MAQYLQLTSHQRFTCKAGYSRSTPGRIRTCDLRIRSPLLYPAELRAHGILRGFRRAGEGNRTPIISLEGWGSTIELHPHFVSRTCRGERIRTSDPLLPKQVRYQAAPRPAETNVSITNGSGV